MASFYPMIVCLGRLHTASKSMGARGRTMIEAASGECLNRRLRTPHAAGARLLATAGPSPTRPPHLAHEWYRWCGQMARAGPRPLHDVPVAPPVAAPTISSYVVRSLQCQFPRRGNDDAMICVACSAASSSVPSLVNVITLRLVAPIAPRPPAGPAAVERRA